MMRTLASVEFEIMLIFRLPCCLSSSVRCIEKVVKIIAVFVDLEISTHADEAQSPRVPVPFLEDPYEAIMHAYLVETDTESEPFEDLVETETPESPHTIASPTSLPDSTPPIRHAKKSPPYPYYTHLGSISPRTVRMAVRVPPAMLPGLSASIAEVAAMSDLAFRKRFRSSYKSSPSLSLPYLPSQKRSWGTSKLVEDDEEEDKEVEKGSNPNSESEDAKDKGLATEDEGPAARDEGLGRRVESLGLRGDEVIPEGQQRVSPVMETVVGEPIGLALKQPTLTTWIDPTDGRVYIDVPAYPPPTPPVQTLPSPEWSSGSLPVSPASSNIYSPISSPMIPLTVPSPVASLATAETEGFLTKLEPRDIEELFTRSGAIAEERRARLDLAEIVDSMRRGYEPKGDV
nr:hypothetical protein [Tanacetum cinerariifolium]